MARRASCRWALTPDQCPEVALDRARDAPNARSQRRRQGNRAVSADVVEHEAALAPEPDARQKFRPRSDVRFPLRKQIASRSWNFRTCQMAAASAMPDRQQQRWLSNADGEVLIALLPQLSDAGGALVERRVIAPWQRRASRIAKRDRALFALAAAYSLPSGRTLANAIVADLNRPGSASSDRRPLVAAVLGHCEGKVPGAEAVRKVLAGLGKNQGVQIAHAGRDIGCTPRKQAADVETPHEGTGG